MGESVTDDGAPTASTVPGSFLRAVDELRDDVREDIGHLRDDVREDNRRLEERVMTAIADARREQRESVEAHAKLHLEAATEQDTELGRIRDFMRNAELSAARRDGALGVFRFVLEQVSRHWQPLVAVVGTVAAAGAFLAGNIRLEVAVR
jgi:hypothetical protein